MLNHLMSGMNGNNLCLIPEKLVSGINNYTPSTINEPFSQRKCSKNYICSAGYWCLIAVLLLQLAYCDMYRVHYTHHCQHGTTLYTMFCSHSDCSTNNRL